MMACIGTPIKEFSLTQLQKKHEHSAVKNDNFISVFTSHVLSGVYYSCFA